MRSAAEDCGSHLTKLHRLTPWVIFLKNPLINLVMIGIVAPLSFFKNPCLIRNLFIWILAYAFKILSFIIFKVF